MIRYDEIIVEKIFLTFVTSNAGHLLLKWSLMLNGPLILPYIWEELHLHFKT